MTIISDEMDYLIFFLAAIVTIIILIYGIGNKVYNFVNKLSKIPNDLSHLKQKYTYTYQDVQILKENIFKIEGQMQIYCKIVDHLITGDK